MSNVNAEPKRPYYEPIDTELDAVSGGSFELSNIVSGVIKSSAAALDTSAPPDVRVGCGWVPQWW